MSEVQEQVAALSRRMGQLAARMAENERQRAEETANITTSLLAVQRALERRTDTTETSRQPIYEEREEQDGAAGNVLPGGLSREPDPRREQTRRGLLDRLGLNSNTYRKEESAVMAVNLEAD